MGYRNIKAKENFKVPVLAYVSHAYTTVLLSIEPSFQSRFITRLAEPGR